MLPFYADNENTFYESYTDRALAGVTRMNILEGVRQLEPFKRLTFIDANSFVSQ